MFYVYSTIISRNLTTYEKSCQRLLKKTSRKATTGNGNGNNVFQYYCKMKNWWYCSSVVLHVCDKLDGGILIVKKFENINNSKAVFEANLINVAVPFGEFLPWLSRLWESKRK